ncbi:hypothetical protein DBV15_08263, partial [Temnothorax longispinosus]
QRYSLNSSKYPYGLKDSLYLHTKHQLTLLVKIKMRPGPPAEPPIIEAPVRRVAQVVPLETIARRQAEEPQAVFRGVGRGRLFADLPFDARILLGRGQNPARFRVGPVGRMRPFADHQVGARILLGRGQNPASSRGHGAPLRE